MFETMSASYVYTPLEQEEIRLLTLLPGKSEDPIICSLEHATLYPLPSVSRAEWERIAGLPQKKRTQRYQEWKSTALDQSSLPDNPRLHAPKQPHYEALSYMWGPSIAYKSILIGAASLPVRNNIWHALSQLRYCDKARTLWIDAICIDLGNNAAFSSWLMLGSL
jgi:hypothetical protein